MLWTDKSKFELCRLIGDNFVFQDDNDPKHSSNYWRNYLRRKEAVGVLAVMN